MKWLYLSTVMMRQVREAEDCDRKQRSENVHKTVRCLFNSEGKTVLNNNFVLKW